MNMADAARTLREFADDLDAAGYAPEAVVGGDWPTKMREIAIRIARAEMERDQARDELRQCRETLTAVMADKPITLFGKPPEYWLDAERAKERLKGNLVAVAEQRNDAQAQAARLRAGIRELQRRFEARRELHTSDFTRVIVGEPEDQRA